MSELAKMKIPGLPRVLTIDEVEAQNHGYGWAEYKREDPGDDLRPAEEFLMETVWLRKTMLLIDAYGAISCGALYLDESYQRDWRIWNSYPSMEQRDDTPWKEAQS